MFDQLWSCYSFFNNFDFFLHDYYETNNVYSTCFGRLPQILGVSAHVYVLRKYTILVFYPSMLLNSLTFLFSYVCMWSTANGRDSKFNLNSDHEKKKTYFHMSSKVFVTTTIKLTVHNFYYCPAEIGVYARICVRRSITNIIILHIKFVRVGVEVASV